MTMTIKDRLQDEAERFATIGHPALLQRFVLRNGRAHTAAPFEGVRGKPKNCFQNAAEMTDGIYCEGFGWRPSLPILIHHAWRITPAGKVIDPTWDRPEECQYFGVQFSREELWDELRRLGTYGLLDTGRGFNLDLFFRRDPGLREFLRG